MNKFKEIELISKILYDIDNIKKAIGRIEYRQLAMGYGEEPTEKEFKVYSQWGEDGITQWLIDNIDIENEVFIEFGVENYEESNTRFLLENNNWSGLVMDGSKKKY